MVCLGICVLFDKVYVWLVVVKGKLVIVIFVFKYFILGFFLIFFINIILFIDIFLEFYVFKYWILLLKLNRIIIECKNCYNFYKVL